MVKRSFTLICRPMVYTLKCIYVLIYIHRSPSHTRSHTNMKVYVHEAYVPAQPLTAICRLSVPHIYTRGNFLFPLRRIRCWRYVLQLLFYRHFFPFSFHNILNLHKETSCALHVLTLQENKKGVKRSRRIFYNPL